MVDWVIGFPWMLPHGLQGHVFFLQADKIDARGMFQVVPESEVDARLVPDVEDLASTGSPLAEDFGTQTFKGVDIVLLPAFPHRQMTEGTATQIQGVEVSGGVGLLLNARIMRGGPMPVTIAGVDIEMSQLGIALQFIGQELGEMGLQSFIEFLNQVQTALALEGVEVMRGLRTVFPMDSMGLEESPPAGTNLQHSLDTKGDPVFITQTRTTAARWARGEEETCGKQQFVVSG